MLSFGQNTLLQIVTQWKYLTNKRAGAHSPIIYRMSYFQHEWEVIFSFGLFQRWMNQQPQLLRKYRVWVKSWDMSCPEKRTKTLYWKEGSSKQVKEQWKTTQPVEIIQSKSGVMDLWFFLVSDHVHWDYGNLSYSERYITSNLPMSRVYFYTFH